MIDRTGNLELSVGPQADRAVRHEILLRLNAVNGFSPDRLRQLAPLAASNGLFELSPEEISGVMEATFEEAARIIKEANSFDVRREQETALASAIKLIDFESPDYPEWLKSIPAAPLVLYVKGALPGEAAVLAVVGSRRPTPYGLRMAARLSEDLAQAGIVIVSGLARGIDTQAHNSALKAGGRTWAVLGCGLDQVYPPENEGLAGEIIACGGCLISEFPFGREPLSFHFPRRNRIISGLSWGTLVIEGRARSGSLITAKAALEQGREVFAVPGPADSPLSEAPHMLIAQGAALVTSAAEILETIPPGLARLRASSAGFQAKSGKSCAPPLSVNQSKILECLGPDALTLDELKEMSGLPLPELASELFEMELNNVVSAGAGQRYAKKN